LGKQQQLPVVVVKDFGMGCKCCLPVVLPKAWEILKDKSLRLIDICELVGYTSEAAFSRVFKTPVAKILGRSM